MSGTNPVAIAVGIILLVILVLGVGYKFIKSQASPSALNISQSDPEYSLVIYLPLFVVLIVFLGIVAFLYFKK